MRAHVVSREARKRATLLFLSSRTVLLTDCEVLLVLETFYVPLPRRYYERVFPTGPTAVFKIRNSRYTNPRGYLDSLLESRQSVRVTRTVKRFTCSFVLLSHVFLKHHGFNEKRCSNVTPRVFRACNPFYFFVKLRYHTSGQSLHYHHDR